MQKFAVDNRLIESEQIILEEEANCTEENAYYSRIIIDRLRGSNVHVVTSDFHMERTQDIFKKVRFTL